MKFNIIEKFDTFEGIDIDEFKEDYFKLPHLELIRKYNLRYDDILKLKNKLNLYKTPKYYHFNNSSNNWKIEKDGTYFCVVQTEEEAKKVVEYLKKNNWDKEQLRKNKNKILKKEEGREYENFVQK